MSGATTVALPPDIRTGSALTTHGLSFQHGREVTLTYPDLHLPAGAQLTITGPSGTGKTTLLHLLAGLLRPTTGEVRFGPTLVSAPQEGLREAFRRTQVGYVFQDFHLMPGLSALENVELGLRVAGTAQPHAKAKAALERLDLGKRLHHAPHQLSTGERQRVALARAVAHSPGLLLVDEPTAHLDRSRAGAALDLLCETADQLGATLIVVTHDPLVAGAFAQRIELGELGLGDKQ
ncbi:ATP-binding cassette domain-containing protein [Deinococcus sp. Arct2-2]|uniref:ABC transporter ATP-binding protein n=1 Tax=Deinococcus sp. Arct2-2 TaxID=2568653 RepID=UPI0010A3AF9D|nr:ATP-binding cassette domain-containing protein [Deinococcus sp. Arct2-2]THF70639.1 ATP-binding cassette domain-containing protein [Deinococcus sp. Arct2-2]